MAKPPLYRTGSTPNRLYHPVKPYEFWPKIGRGLRDLRVRQVALQGKVLARLRGLGTSVRT
jgi:hypothetical protein